MCEYNKIKHLASNEVKSAVNWWAKTIEDSHNKNQIEYFKEVLENIIYGKIYNHWYPSEPSKGSAYRSILNDNKIDNILMMACKYTGIQPEKLAGRVVVIISPGIVRVRSLMYEKEEIIYSGDVNI